MSIRNEVTQRIEPVIVRKTGIPVQVSTYYGENTFSEMTMKRMISEETFESFKRWQEEGTVITMAQADEIAHAMKEWSISKGATSYTHWFQPMTGLTAEKHDSFISLSNDGNVIEKFTGSKLFRENPMHHLSHREEFERLSKPEAILPGIHLLRLSSPRLTAVKSSVYHLYSYPTQ